MSGLGLLNSYRQVYGSLSDTLLIVGSSSNRGQTDLPISKDSLLAAPIWHDWAKAIVFQWNADGTEFTELEFGGNGTTDNNGAAGDSRTSAHHIISLAEAMKRGLAAEFVITQASAHAAPTLGNEYKVVNWLNAAAILAHTNLILECVR
ncbi:MAG: hypothetical protein LH702_07590 [Phormidesmis sp. CAN_BIN44]|nr:hypothetical protein [Phormidesmis sp. CAN_BIN44]